jgi:protein-disulfide isomerase
MSSNLTNAERRRLERRRRRTLNTIVVIGISLIAAGLVLYLALRPIDDLVQVTPRNFPVPVDGLVIGDPDAPVLIEAFEDFQCPSCKLFTDDIEGLVLDQYVFNGTARFQYRFYPFLGSESLDAANAAMCANELGRFWDFHDMLFANQVGENLGAFSNRRLETMATQLGLDVEAWSDCYDSERYEDVILADFEEGRERGVLGTPAIFVNGELLAGFDFSVIANAVAAAASGQ